jgi:hypothetical protein
VSKYSAEISRVTYSLVLSVTFMFFLLQSSVSIVYGQSKVLVFSGHMRFSFILPCHSIGCTGVFIYIAKCSLSFQYILENNTGMIYKTLFIH